MDWNSKNYGSLIDKIRKDRNISREELCDNIMSNRTYQRFVSGETSISSEKIAQIIDKMMLDTYSLQEIYRTYNQNEYHKLKKAFSLVSQWKETEASTILATIDYDSITSSANKQIYDFTNLLIKWGSDKISSADFYSNIKTIIGYPEILSKRILNSIELNALFSLMVLQYKNKRTEIVDFFEDLLSNFDSTSYWITNEVKTGIYTNLIKSIYHLGDYEKCYKLCEEAAQLNLIIGNISGLPNIFGYQALSYKKLGLFEEMMSSATKLYMLILIENDEKKLIFFKNLITKHLKINIEDILTIKKEV
jgi:transcriptional regulator with XRE-family HTH domain